MVDVVEALTDSSKPRVYWNAMKTRVKANDGIELSTNCRQLKLESADGKKYKTDCANTEGIFRIIIGVLIVPVPVSVISVIVDMVRSPITVYSYLVHWRV